jgi:hypothetical protein
LHPISTVAPNPIRPEAAMSRTHRIALALLFAAASACARDPGTPGGAPDAPAGAQLPAATPDIIGTIRRADGSGNVRVVLIEQDSTRSAGYPVATVHVTAATRVLRQTGGGAVPARPADLAVGTRVRAWFTGPVRESYPVQADAATVLIGG